MTLWRATAGPGADLGGFRTEVRRLAAAGAPPEAVTWHETAPVPPADAAAPPVPLPRAVSGLVETVIRHRDPGRHGLLYALIWRVRHGERHLPEVASDPLMHRLRRMEKAVRRDLHKMHAFVRFRRTETDGHERFTAWFEPDHFILEAAAGFFVERFRALDWTIITPDGSVRWDRTRLVFGPPGRREDAPSPDGFEAGWLGYYEATFNPARTNLRATCAEMPRRYWRNLPEAAAIPGMIQAAPARVREMIEREAAMPVKRDPEKAVAAMADAGPSTLAELNAVIASSEPMVEGGTRAVLGEGPLGPAVAFLGEQPGDQEDLAGRPFVGPAGQLLDRALRTVGIDRQAVYITNAVKHFKFVQRGKRRLHQRPTAGEIKHYRWWLDREIELVAPRLVVALGATATQALAGKALPITRSRGPMKFGARAGYVTVHPSYLLRLPDEAAKAREWDAFLRDLEQVRDLAAAA